MNTEASSRATQAGTHDRYFDDDRYEDFDDDECPRCHGDGADPWWDGLLPCPVCQGEQPATQPQKGANRADQA